MCKTGILFSSFFKSEKASLDPLYVEWSQNQEKQPQRNTNVLNVSTYFWSYNSHEKFQFSSNFQKGILSILTLSLTSSCSRCVQKLWWGWVGWGWRQILPPHRHNATLREGVGGEREREEPWSIQFWFISGKWDVGEANREQAVNLKPAPISGLYQHQAYCSQTKWN